MKKKIIFLCPSLKIGGSEKVLTTILNHLDRSRFSISLALVKHEGELTDQIPNDVNIIDFNSKRSRYIFIKYLKLIWEIRPHIIFSTLGHLNIIVIMMKYLCPQKIKYICRETNIPSIKYHKNPKKYIYKFLYLLFYRNYNSIICQSKDMLDDLKNNFKIPNYKLSIINNPCDIDNINNRIKGDEILFSDKKINILSVGSLTYQKGFDLLLEAISKLNDSNYYFTIMGDGPENTNLNNLAKKLNIKHMVNIIGNKNNPYIYMEQADLFVLSSRYEGFPNVVLESLACGTPVVTFDCPGNLSEIIVDGFNGYVAKYLDTDDLMIKIISAKRTKFQSKNFIDLISKKYNVNKVIKDYQSLLLK